MNYNLEFPENLFEVCKLNSKFENVKYKKYKWYNN